MQRMLTPPFVFKNGKLLHVAKIKIAAIAPKLINISANCSSIIPASPADWGVDAIELRR